VSSSAVIRSLIAGLSAIVIACRPLPTAATADQRALTPVLAGGDRQYSDVTAGFVHTCAIASDGAAYCWGNDDYSQLGPARADESCGGRPCSTTPLRVDGELRFRTLAAGWVKNCGITTDGRTWCWGGDPGMRTPERVVADSTFTSVAVGDGHACALTASGMAFCWGENTWGQLGDGTNTDRSTPVAVRTDVRFRSLSVGAYHACGVSVSGDGWCWGDNRWGQLGAGDVPYNSMSSSASLPRRIEGLKLNAVAAGWEHSCGLSTDGLAFCWGRNDDARQLGDDSGITHRGIPGAVAGARKFAALSAGPLSTCARTATDDVYCWGGNYYGGLGNGDAVPNGVGHPVRTLGGPFQRVTLGQGHSCGIATDRRLWCWGDQSAGQF